MLWKWGGMLGCSLMLHLGITINRKCLRAETQLTAPKCTRATQHLQPQKLGWKISEFLHMLFKVVTSLLITGDSLGSEIKCRQPGSNKLWVRYMVGVNWGGQIVAAASGSRGGDSKCTAMDWSLHQVRSVLRWNIFLSGNRAAVMDSKWDPVMSPIFDGIGLTSLLIPAYYVSCSTCHVSLPSTANNDSSNYDGFVRLQIRNTISQRADFPHLSTANSSFTQWFGPYRLPFPLHLLVCETAEALQKRKKPREAASPPIFPIFLPSSFFLELEQNLVSNTQVLLCSGSDRKSTKFNGKIPRSLCCSLDYFQLPSGYIPLAVQACGVAVGAQRRGFSAKPLTKRSLVSLCEAWGSWVFHFVQTCDSSAFPCSHSHRNMPPARRGAECKAVESMFFSSSPFFLSALVAPWSLPPSSPQACHPGAAVAHCPISSTSSIPADTWGGCWVTAPSHGCEIQIRACFAVLSRCAFHRPCSTATSLTASSQNNLETTYGGRTTGACGEGLFRKKALEVMLYIWHTWLRHGSFGLAKIWK